jgi:hypothetical protein
MLCNILYLKFNKNKESSIRMQPPKIKINNTLLPTLSGPQQYSNNNEELMEAVETWLSKKIGRQGFIPGIQVSPLRSSRDGPKEQPTAIHGPFGPTFLPLEKAQISCTRIGHTFFSVLVLLTADRRLLRELPSLCKLGYCCFHPHVSSSYSLPLIHSFSAI